MQSLSGFECQALSKPSKFLDCDQLNVLPEEILSEIFSLLSIGDLGALACVSTACKKSSEKDVVWLKHCDKYSNGTIKTILNLKHKLHQLLEERVSLAVINQDMSFTNYGTEKIFDSSIIGFLESDASLCEKEKALRFHLDNSVCSDGAKSFLSLAAQGYGTNQELFDLLLQCGANPNIYTGSSYYSTPLFDAIYGDGYFTHVINFQAAKKLIDYGADIAIKNKDGKSVFDVAKDFNMPAEELQEYAKLHSR